LHTAAVGDVDGLPVTVTVIVPTLSSAAPVPDGAIVVSFPSYGAGAMMMTADSSAGAGAMMIKADSSAAGVSVVEIVSV
jgi:hypothetical protein